MERKADKAFMGNQHPRKEAFCEFLEFQHNSEFHYSVLLSDIPSPELGSLTVITDSVFICFQTWA